MPGYDGLWPDDDQRSVPILPTLGQPHPKEAIRLPRPRPRALALEHCQLLTKGEILPGDISEVSGRNEKTKQRTKEREHGVKGEVRQWKMSIVFSLMWFWRSTTNRMERI